MTYKVVIMTTQALITIDTELSLALHQQGVSGEDNLRSSVFGICDEGEFGIVYQMERMDAYGLKGIFFVDPMPALAFGTDIVRQIVEPILERGHDVQLHIHTEWLEFIEAQPVGELRGRSIGDFPYEAQVTLLKLARQLLMDAGAPEPMAFRAGNYGASDDTLRALAEIGMAYDTSFNPAYLDDGCDISLPEESTGPAEHEGVTVLPVSGIYESADTIRHAQVCALSSQEMEAALDHAAREKMPVFNIVTHSFEMLSRDRQRPNHVVIGRFEKLCAAIAGHRKIDSATFETEGLDEFLEEAEATGERLPPNAVRTWIRRLQQAYANVRYERG